MSVEQVLRSCAGHQLPPASISQTTASIASSDLSAMSLGGAVSSPTLQARREAAVERFVRGHGFTFKGNIDKLIEAEANRMVEWSLFGSAQEAEDAIRKAYQAFVQKAGRKKLDKVREILRDPNGQIADAVAAARIKEKQAENEALGADLDQAQIAVSEAVKTWLGIHKKLKALGVDALVQGWEQLALSNKRGPERKQMRALLRKEKEAREELEGAQKKRDSLQKRRDEILHYLDPCEYRPAKEVEAELEQFSFFLRDCFCANQFNGFVQTRVKTLQNRFSMAYWDCTNHFDPTEGPDDFDDVDVNDGYERLYSNGMLHEAEEDYIDADKFLQTRLQYIEESTTLTPEERFDLEIEARKGLRNAHKELDRLEKRYENLQDELRAIRDLLGKEPLSKPNYSKIEEAASVLGNHVDLGDAEQVAAFWQKMMAEREAHDAACDTIDSRAEEADICFETIDDAYNELLTKLQEEMEEFDHILPLLLENEGLVYEGPRKDDVVAFIELHKLRDHAWGEKRRLCDERYKLAGEWRDQDAFIGTVSPAIDLCAYMEVHSNL